MMHATQNIISFANGRQTTLFPNIFCGYWCASSKNIFRLAFKIYYLLYMLHVSYVKCILSLFKRLYIVF